MERELRNNLLTVLAAFQALKQTGRSTLGRMAAGDWRFFDRLLDGETTFTARKYDGVITWFSDNWPEGAIWPEGIVRPAKTEPTTSEETS